MKHNMMRSTAALLCFSLFFSCATGGRGGRATGTPLFYGYGTGPTATESLTAARQEILKEVLGIILSLQVREAKYRELDDLFYSNPRLGGYFLSDTLEVLAQGKENDTFYSRIGVRVDLPAVVRTLEGNDIYGGMVLPGARIALPDAEPPRAAGGAGGETGFEETGGDGATAGAGATGAEGSATPGQSGAGGSGGTDAGSVRHVGEMPRAVAEYLESLRFLVYFDTDAEVDPFLMKAAVSIANRYLAENGIQLVDLDTVESVKRDQELAYETQTGEAVSLIQWIALKLNADIYVEIDAETTAETRDGKYYGQANITLKFFDSSTAALLASVPYRSPRTFSSSSELDALNNAIQSSVYQAMPPALDQVYTRVETIVAEGIPYELIILRPPDSRLMRDFMRELELRVEKVRLVSQSREEVRYRVYLLGTVGELQDIVFSISDSIPILRNLELVYLRGKSVTFESGL